MFFVTIIAEWYILNSGKFEIYSTGSGSRDKKHALVVVNGVPIYRPIRYFQGPLNSVKRGSGEADGGRQQQKNDTLDCICLLYKT